MNPRIAGIVLCALLAISCARREGTESSGRDQVPNDRPSTAGRDAGARGADTRGSDVPEIPEIPIDVMPKLIDAKVTYPEEARQRREEGMVNVKALVGRDGRVKMAVVESSQPASEILGAAAVQAVRGWTFEPALAKGEPVEIWIIVPVNFRLQ